MGARLRMQEVDDARTRAEEHAKAAQDAHSSREDTARQLERITASYMELVRCARRGAQPVRFCDAARAVDATHITSCGHLLPHTLAPS
ncbi:hypothetical protein EON67_09105 [archaeon]|nr:MAG: hypothetical protein EON67_09105 [archaeon]